jgi:hypothetical protein
MELMIFCARATRGLRRPSLDARSGRSISLHPLRDNERAWKDHLYRFDARNRGSTRLPLIMTWGIGLPRAVKDHSALISEDHEQAWKD